MIWFLWWTQWMHQESTWTQNKYPAYFKRSVYFLVPRAHTCCNFYGKHKEWGFIFVRSIAKFLTSPSLYPQSQRDNTKGKALALHRGWPWFNPQHRLWYPAPRVFTLDHRARNNSWETPGMPQSTPLKIKNGGALWLMNWRRDWDYFFVEFARMGLCC